METPIIAGVEGVYVGNAINTLSTGANRLTLNWDGVVGSFRHSGRTRKSGSREKRHISKGTEILNLRQVSIVSENDCAIMAQQLGLPRIFPEDLGANLFLKDVIGLTKLSVGTIMVFQSGAAVFITAKNKPCIQPGNNITARYPDEKRDPGLASQFVEVAMDLRGLVAIVYCPGPITVGDSVSIYKP